MTKLLEQIESRLAVCAKATPGPWMLDHQNCFIFTQESDGSCGDMVLEIRGYGSGKPGKANGEFTVASRNQREGELAALKESLRCIEQFRSQNHRRGYPTGPEWMALISGAETALAQITKLLSGEGKDLGEDE